MNFLPKKSRPSLQTSKSQNFEKQRLFLSGKSVIVLKTPLISQNNFSEPKTFEKVKGEMKWTIESFFKKAAIYFGSSSIWNLLTELGLIDLNK